jgi:Spinocerebellar ataxia type 10 protein domain
MAIKAWSSGRTRDWEQLRHKLSEAPSPTSPYHGSDPLHQGTYTNDQDADPAHIKCCIADACQQFKWYHQALDEAHQRQSNESDCYDSSESTVIALSKEQRRGLIQDTRNALRFGIQLLSTGRNNTAQLQNWAVEAQWLPVLSSIISHVRKGDETCCILSAKLLNNLVAGGNVQAARAMTMAIPLGPNQESNPASQPNWTDMIIRLGRSGRRAALAPVVAALHACVVTLAPLDHDENHDLEPRFFERISRHSLLISNLLRQLISAKSMLAHQRNHTEDKVMLNDEVRDQATEWIITLLEKLCQLGMLPCLYAAASGGPTSELLLASRVFPEQNVLLYCVYDALDENICGSSSCLLGWEDTSGSGPMRSYSFLASLYVHHHQHISSNVDGNPADDDADLMEDADCTILDIIGLSLGVDFPGGLAVREKLGSSQCVHALSMTRDAGEGTSVGSHSPDHDFFATVLSDLAGMVDALLLSAHGKKARDVPHLTGRQSRRILSLVRVIGNLCYQCPLNQDRLREISLPPPVKNGNGNEPPHRTGLHVLLSCTGVALTCLGLREWAIVAIRHALQDNSANQEVVTQLEANESVQSANLQDMGIRVSLDSRNGNVSVEPLP